MSQKERFETVKEAVIYSAKKVSLLLKKYNSQTRVALFYDNDPDGICSAIIFEKFLGINNIPVVERIPSSEDFTPFSKEFNEKLKERRIDVLVFLDFNIHGFGYFESYTKFRSQHPEIEIIIFDHHQDPSDYKNEFYLNSNELQKQISGSQFCCSKFVYEVCRILSKDMVLSQWLKSIGIIGDSNQKTWGQDIINQIKEINLELIDSGLNAKELSIPKEFDDYFNTPFGKVANLIFYGLAKSPKEINKIYSKLYESKNVFEALTKLDDYKLVEAEVNDYIENFNYFLKNSKEALDNSKLQVFEMEVIGEYDITCILSNILSHKNKDILFFIYKKKKDNFVYVSLRLQNQKVNLGILAETALDFTDGNGGGHAVAAGLRVKKDDFKNLKRKIFDKILDLEVKNE